MRAARYSGPLVSGPCLFSLISVQREPAKDLEAKRKKGCFSSETDSGYDGKLAWNKGDRVDLADTSRNKSIGTYYFC